MTEQSPRKPWFAAKRYGYGAGLPISWEGWTGLGLLLGLAIGGQFVLPPQVHIPLVLAAAALFAGVAYRRTEGGWRWRWRGRRG